ncbi:hypothetical protein ABPG75_005550 [Micractinium tetrahymenae]
MDDLELVASANHNAGGKDGERIRLVLHEQGSSGRHDWLATARTCCGGKLSAPSMMALPLALLALTAGLMSLLAPCGASSLLAPFAFGRCGGTRLSAALPPPTPPQALQPAPGQGSRTASPPAAAISSAHVPSSPLPSPPLPIPPPPAPMGPPDRWAQPSQQSLARLQAEPGLAQQEPSLLSEYVAAPWLLPPGAAARLPYHGVHDLDALLAMRAAPAGGFGRAVVLLAFDKVYGVMVQNCIYTLAKLGGAANYLLFAWTPADLAACAALHLPCADASTLLPAPLDHQADSVFGSHDFNAIQWLKALVTLRALRAGLVVMLSDGDVAYVAKPVWRTFHTLLSASSADGVFQGTGSLVAPLNTGTYVIRPTPGGIEAIRRWAGMASSTFSEQDGMARIHHKAYESCTRVEECRQKRSQMRSGGPPALFQWFPSAQSVVSGEPSNCALARPEFAHRIDPCAWFVLLLHPVCTGRPGKPLALHWQDMWLIDDAEPGQQKGCVPWNASDPRAAEQAVPACQPLSWRQPAAEDHLRWCQADLALVPSLAAPPRKPGSTVRTVHEGAARAAPLQPGKPP